LWLSEAGLIPQIILLFNPANDSDVHENIAQALVDIIGISILNSANSPLLNQLYSPPITHQMFTYMLQGSSSALLNTLTVIIELLKHVAEDKTENIFKIEFLKTVLNFMPPIRDKLKPTGTEAVITTTFGDIVPLGFQRLKIVEFYLHLAKLNREFVDDELIKFNIYQECLELFFQYMWNNFLHIFVERMVVAVMNGSNLRAKLHLLQGCNLLHRIVDTIKANKLEIEQPGGIGRGYMGFLYNMAVQISKESLQNPDVAKLIEGIPDWKDHVGESIEAQEQKEAAKKPTVWSIGTDDGTEEDNIDGLTNEMIFRPYQATTGFEHEFPDEFNDTNDYEEEDSPISLEKEEVIRAGQMAF